MEAAINYLSVDPTKAEFINDEEFQLKDFNPTAENVLDLMSPNMIKAIFSKKNRVQLLQEYKALTGNSQKDYLMPLKLLKLILLKGCSNFR
jgi:hypothetical protein